MLQATNACHQDLYVAQFFLLAMHMSQIPCFLSKGEQVRTIPAHGKQVTRLEFIGKTDQFVTCSGDQQVRFWNADKGNNTRNFGGSGDFLYAVGVSPDGALVAAGGEEGVVRLYNGTNAQLIKVLVPPGVEAPKK